MTVALVTGGNRGLGLATARGLAAGGAHVLLAGRDPDRAGPAAALLRSDGLDVEALTLDVTDPAGIAAAAERVARSPGRLDVLVNNAGVLPEATDPGTYGFAGLEAFRATFAVNVFGAVAVTEAFLPLLRRSPAGRIVNVSSRMGSLADQADPASPYAGLTVPAYRGSKAALNSVTIGLATALAGTGIVVTAVCPGFVRTDLTPANREQAPLSAAEAAEVVVAAATLPPGARSGTFVDAAGLVPW
jgi:NAD(P)-dependent dehydrogenase (short-subunit alcohol dehydrogenase family)